MDEEKWDADAEDADDGDEDDEELGEALLPDRTTLVGNGAARINRSNESILTLCWSWFCFCCAVIKIPANTSYDDDDGPEELTGIINYVSTLQFRSSFPFAELWCLTNRTRNIELALLDGYNR